MEGVCRHRVVAATMPVLEIASTSTGARSHASRGVRMAPLQSAFLGSAVPLRHRSKICTFSRRASRASSICSASGGSSSSSCRMPEPVPEVFFYSGSAVGQNPAGGKRINWKIASVAGEVKEMAASFEDAPFASWSNLGHNEGKRKDLRKILVLGAGLVADPRGILAFCILFLLQSSDL